MAKFSGAIGFIKEENTAPGVWSPICTERYYYGDILKNYKKWENGTSINDNIDISNRISIVADPFAFENYFAMKYVRLAGINWKIENVEIQYPRLILSLGGIYNNVE